MSMDMSTLKGDQAAAYDAVARWFNTPVRQRKKVFRLYGGAGVGKTWVARLFGNLTNVAYMTLSGKAALVMQSKGCYGASTIHSSIYKLDGDDGAGVMSWELREDALKGIGLICLDEAAMASVPIGLDLESFGIPILGLGDQNQLPPPSDEPGYLDMEPPDFVMRKVLRQAEDSPIIHMAYQALEHGSLKPGKYGNSTVYSDKIRMDKIKEIMLAADQVICGKNATRHTYNAEMRKWKGLAGEQAVHCPTVGERLMCLKNNREKGILNGEQFVIREVLAKDLGRVASLVVASLDSGSDRPIEIEVPWNYFNGTEGQMPNYERANYDQFSYAELITCHKAQGSTYVNPLIVDESRVFRENSRRWLYTAITRASESVGVM